MATKIKIETAKGIMIAELYDETPITSNNFKKLVEQGFYNGLNFHRVIPVIEGVEVVDFIRPGDSIVSMEVIK